MGGTSADTAGIWLSTRTPRCRPSDAYLAPGRPLRILAMDIKLVVFPAGRQVCRCLGIRGQNHPWSYPSHPKLVMVQTSVPQRKKTKKPSRPGTLTPEIHSRCGSTWVAQLGKMIAGFARPGPQTADISSVLGIPKENARTPNWAEKAEPCRRSRNRRPLRQRGDGGRQGGLPPSSLSRNSRAELFRHLDGAPSSWRPAAPSPEPRRVVSWRPPRPKITRPAAIGRERAGHRPALHRSIEARGSSTAVAPGFACARFLPSMKFIAGAPITPRHELVWWLGRKLGSACPICWILAPRA